ncbi:MAG: DUF2911 domain-containing protein [Bacteroidetes bacterium]|nr:DUF2911 domain-containing protein [Bacteroidota bacterium]MBK9401784.1 DUF2911 domain-containing protein [Bacteroidota bacterium]
MKKLILVSCAIVFATLVADAQSLKVPAPSPSQTLKQDFALSTIEISYSRPGVKNRTIFGDIVPFGTLWRTGANSATTISFGDTVMIGGVKVNPGKYGLLTIPGQTEWVVIISKSTTTTGADDYKKEEDVVRMNVKPSALSSKVETFTIQLENIKNNSCDLQLMWDKTMVSVGISTDIDGRIMKDIQKLVVNDSRPYGAAANYYMENGKDLKLAAEWYDKAIAGNPKAYWLVHQKANCQAKMGLKKEAVETANKSIAIAKEQGDDNYVRLNEKLIETLK